MAWWNLLRLFTPKPPETLLEEVVDDTWKWYRNSAKGSRGIRFMARYREGHEAVRARLDGLVREYGLVPCGQQLWSRHEQHATAYNLGEKEWIELHVPPPRGSIEVEFELVNCGTPPEERRALIGDIVQFVADADYGNGYRGHPMTYPWPCVAFEKTRDKP